VPGAGPSQIHDAINDRGEIAGSFVDVGAEISPDGLYPPDTVHGFVRERPWSGRGRLHRRCRPSARLRLRPGPVHDDRRPRPLDPVAMGSIATGINDRGEIVVAEPVNAIVAPREDS
jgi:hypothetical protein